MTDCTFIIPDTNTFQSGGNLYNARLIEALKVLGYSVDSYELDAISQVNESKCYLVDSLHLTDIHLLNHLENKYLIVHHLESLFPSKGEDGRALFEQNERPLLEQFDGFLVTSTFTKHYLEAKGIDQAIHCILPGLDYSFASGTKRFDQVHAIMVANLIERKGILPFLEALQNKSNREWKLSLVGNIEMEQTYAHKCLNLINELEGVEYLGELPQKEVFELYEKANLFLSTAYMETYGMAIQEAKQAGLPLLLLNGGNACNHLDKDTTGWCCESIDNLVDQFFTFVKQPSLLDNQSHVPSTYVWKDAALLFTNAFFKN